MVRGACPSNVNRGDVVCLSVCPSCVVASVTAVTVYKALSCMPRGTAGSDHLSTASRAHGWLVGPHAGFVHLQIKRYNAIGWQPTVLPYECRPNGAFETVGLCSRCPMDRVVPAVFNASEWQSWELVADAANVHSVLWSDASPLPTVKRRGLIHFRDRSRTSENIRQTRPHAHFVAEECHHQ